MLTTGNIITADVRCFSCGYNLRTLSTAGRCPECGMSIAAWWRSSLFRAGPSFLNRLAVAISLTAVANVIAIVGALVFQVLIIAFESMHSIGLWWLLVPAAACAGIALVHVIGDFISTTPPPGRTALRYAAKLRVFSVTYFGLLVAALVSYFSFSYAYPLIAEVELALVIGWTASLPIFSLYHFAAGRFFVRLCHRAGLHALKSWHSGIWMGLAIGAFLTDASLILAMVFQYFDLGDIFTDACGIVFLFGSCVTILIFIAIAILLFRTAHHFRRLANTLPFAPAKPA